MTTTFLQLPLDIQREIFSYAFDIPTLLEIRRISKYLRDLISTSVQHLSPLSERCGAPGKVLPSEELSRERSSPEISDLSRKEVPSRFIFLFPNLISCRYTIAVESVHNLSSLGEMKYLCWADLRVYSGDVGNPLCYVDTFLESWSESLRQRPFEYKFTFGSKHPEYTVKISPTELALSRCVPQETEEASGDRLSRTFSIDHGMIHSHKVREIQRKVEFTSYKGPLTKGLIVHGVKECTLDYHADISDRLDVIIRLLTQGLTRLKLEIKKDFFNVSYFSVRVSLFLSELSKLQRAFPQIKETVPVPFTAYLCAVEIFPNLEQISLIVDSRRSIDHAEFYWSNIRNNLIPLIDIYVENSSVGTMDIPEDLLGRVQIKIFA